MSVFSVSYRTVDLGEVQMFYREAGSRSSPALLLLHGFPTSSYMFRNIIPQLADKFRVVAPDLPGFGYTTAPTRGKYAYTFGNLYKAIRLFIDAVSLIRFAMLVFDYGAPV